MNYELRIKNYELRVMSDLKKTDNIVQSLK